MAASDIQPIEIAIVRHLRPSIDVPRWAILFPIGVACVVSVLPLAESRLAVGSDVTVACACLLAFLLIAGYLELVRRTGHADGAAVVEQRNEWPSSHASVLCYGTKRELRDLLETPAPLPEPFVAPRGGVSKLIFWPFMFVGQPFLRMIGLSPTLVPMIWGAAALLLPFVRLSHKYYRVFPGRLQVLHGPLFSSEITVERDMSLDGGTIMCRFDERKLVITQSDGQSETIDLMAIDNPHALAQAVLRAAVFPVPPVEPCPSTLMS